MSVRLEMSCLYFANAELTCRCAKQVDAARTSMQFHQFHQFLTASHIRKWREESHVGAGSRRRLIRAAVLWAVGVFLMVVDFLLLVVFFARFSHMMSQHGVSGWIGPYISAFTALQSVMKTITVTVFRWNESERIGTDQASFDRYSLVNLSYLHYCCVGAVYLQVLQVTYKSWYDFWMVMIWNQLLSLASYGFYVADWGAILRGDAPERRDWRGRLAGFFPADPLNTRGLTCFYAYIDIMANCIAAVQFIVFVLIQALLPYNAPVFIQFSTSIPHDSYEPLQQAAFVCAGLAINYAMYCAMDGWMGWWFGLTPTYVGTSYMTQYPKFGRTMLVVSTHAVTDLYLGVLLVSIAGVLMVSECSDDGKWLGSAATIVNCTQP